MDMNRMTVKLQEALQSASAIAMRRGHQGIDVEHLLLALLDQENGIAASLLEHAGVSPAAVRQSADQALAKLAQVQGPGMGFNLPSSDSSPAYTWLSTALVGIICSAARMPSAMARSRPAPSFLIFAGARFTVIFFTGKWNPLFLSAARTRSRLSRTVASGSPTMENWGRPEERSTSTSTRCASTPTIAALRTFASTITSPARMRRADLMRMS